MKKSRLLSYKKYGSDRSSNTPIKDHTYSISQQPISIFDRGSTHSFSKNEMSKQKMTALRNTNERERKTNSVLSNIDKKMGKKKVLGQ